jgi:hypothetical protein
MMMKGSARVFKMRGRCCGNGCYSARVADLGVDAYVFDVLMADLIAHDRQPSAFVLYLAIWRLTDGGKKKSAPISLRTLSEQTGLSKRAIQDAADRLERRQLISIERQMPTAVPVYRLHKTWLRKEGSKAQRLKGPEDA